MTGNIFESTFEEIPAQAAILDEDGYVLHANQNWIDFDQTNAVDNAEPGFNYLELCEKKDENDIKGKIQQLIQSDKTQIKIEYSQDKLNGKKDWFALRASQFYHNDECHLLIVHWDITQRKRIENNLKNFGSILRHDIRNHLSVAEGYLDFIETEQEEKKQRVEDALQDINRTVDSTLTLTGENKTHEKRELSLERTAQDAWESIETKNAELDVHEQTLHADHKLLVQLFENIFKNSIQHGGKDNIKITISPTDNGFKIKDNGNGTNTDQPHKLLRYGESGSNGTGLGLAIVRRVTEIHNWNIEITETNNGFELHISTSSSE